MTGKVILPTEVAKAIEELRSEKFTDFGIITGMNTNGQGPFNTINRWSYKNGCRNTDKVLSALINGYEVEKVEFGKYTDPEIYLGLIALSFEDDNYGWFLKGAADAFIQNSNLVIELLEELNIARDPNHEPAEWYKEDNSPGPSLKNITFADKAEGEAFFAEAESQLEDESVSKEPKTQEEHVAKFERARRRIQWAKDQEASSRMYVDEVMKSALDKIAQGSGENDGNA